MSDFIRWCLRLCIATGLIGMLVCIFAGDAPRGFGFVMFGAACLGLLEYEYWDQRLTGDYDQDEDDEEEEEEDKQIDPASGAA